MQPDLASHDRNRRLLFLWAMVLIASALLTIPAAILEPQQQPGWIVVVEALICGVLIGLGRQGIDLLAIRIVVTTALLLIGWVVGGDLHQHVAVCGNLTDCQHLALGLIFGLAIVAPLLALIAIPAALAWNRGIRQLKPELPWRNAPRPRAWWQWVLVVVVAVVLVYMLPLVFGIPSN